jgi:hypothetical protein
VGEEKRLQGTSGGPKWLFIHFPSQYFSVRKFPENSKRCFLVGARQLAGSNDIKVQASAYILSVRVTHPSPSSFNGVTMIEGLSAAQRYKLFEMRSNHRT